MRKIIFIGAVIFVCCLNACHEKTVGYLISENASYEPDTLVVPRELDPVKDAIRIKNQSPWVSYAMQGYQGTEQIMFSVESVTDQEITLYTERADGIGGFPGIRDLNCRGG